jgi:hypothetical protein
MGRSACVNLWVAGLVLSASAPVIGSLPAHDRERVDQDRQTVVIRLGSSDAETVNEFEHRLRDYDNVRRRLDAGLPAATVSDDPAAIHRVVEVHHQALQSARVQARQGDIFFEAVAEMFRSRIRESLHGMTPGQFLASITEADAPLSPGHPLTRHILRALP